MIGTHPEVTVMQKAPAAFDDSVAAELGSVLELALEGHVFRWTKGQAKLLWFPKYRVLGWMQGVKGSRFRKSYVDEVLQRSDAARRARQNFEDWSQREIEGARVQEFPTMKNAVWVRYSDKPTRIDYASDKWDREDQYTHEIGKGVRLYRYGGKRQSPWFWVLRGGKLRVTERGIIG